MSLQLACTKTADALQCMVNPSWMHSAGCQGQVLLHLVTSSKCSRFCTWAAFRHSTLAMLAFTAGSCSTSQKGQAAGHKMTASGHTVMISRMISRMVKSMQGRSHSILSCKMTGKGPVMAIPKGKAVGIEVDPRGPAGATLPALGLCRDALLSAACQC